MLRRLRPSPAMCVALLALLVALGGTSYAVLALPKNSVGTKQLRNGAVTAKKVHAHTLLAKDFKAGQLPAGKRGPAGPQGATGAQGPKGDPGTNGTAFAYAHVQANGTLDAAISKNVTAAALSIALAARYCLTVTGRPENAVATVNGGGNGFATVELAPSGGELGLIECPPSTDAIVTTDNSSGAPTPEPFYIAFN